MNERTVTLNGNPKLLRLVEDIVKILGVQLSSKEGIPVHCPTSAKIRGMGVCRINSLPGVNGSRFAKFFSARV
jgi:hypothetical protein